MAEPAATPHIHRVYSTRPPHDLIRAVACTCSVGSDHSNYESP